MSLRDSFLMTLAENEGDTTTRPVYADWLDDQGEHEEADRQRKWPAAKENSSYREITYGDLIEFGRLVVKRHVTRDRTYTRNEAMWAALQANSQEFWSN